MHVDPIHDGQPAMVNHVDDWLPSLAQQVLIKQLNLSRWVLLIFGALFTAGGIAMIPTSDRLARLAVDQELEKEIGGRQNIDPERKQDVDDMEQSTGRALKIMGALGIGLGISYLAFGVFVNRRPAPITIVAFIMFGAVNAVLVAKSDNPAEVLSGLWIVQAGILIVLGIPVYSAIAYERHRIHRERERRKRLEDEERRKQSMLGDGLSEETERDEDSRVVRRRRRPSFQEDLYPIKIVLGAFGLLLGMSIVYGWYLHFGGGLANGDRKEMEMELLRQMLIFDVFSSVLVLVAIGVSGWPEPIPAHSTHRAFAWCMGAPALGVVLCINILYCHLLRDYVGRQPHLEVVEVNFQTHFWLVLLTMCIQPAIFEELFFRYLTLGHLRRFMGDHSAIWVTAAMFGFAHLHNPLGMPVLILCGAAFGYMRVWSGGLLLPMLMHGFHNAIVIALEG